MGFKKMTEIVDNKLSSKLRLEDDGDFINGVFLYKSIDDAMICDCHYISNKQNGFYGYVHCLEEGCPACQHNTPIKSKLFIPFLVIADLNKHLSDLYPEDTVIFWDRNQPFNGQLYRDVFKKYENPSEYIFKITRHGERNDKNTRYEITPMLNYPYSIDERLKEFSITFPEYYETICKSMSRIEMEELIASSKRDYSGSLNGQSSNFGEFSYEVKPRTVVDPEAVIEDDAEDVEEITLADYKPNSESGASVVDDSKSDGEVEVKF